MEVFAATDIVALYLDEALEIFEKSGIKATEIITTASPRRNDGVDGERGDKRGSGNERGSGSKRVSVNERGSWNERVSRSKSGNERGSWNERVSGSKSGNERGSWNERVSVNERGSGNKRRRVVSVKQLRSNEVSIIVTPAADIEEIFKNGAATAELTPEQPTTLAPETQATLTTE